MPAKCLERHCVERIWGRCQLPGPFADCVGGTEPIGEIWFKDDEARGGELLVKYLFTSERLSIQVHPDDRSARAIGHPSGKDEAWLVLEAEPDSVIGLGLKHRVSTTELGQAAASGEIEQLIDWRPVAAGDLYYSPAGTVHAIGAGLALIEIQQNLDLTYRLYDYGRPRELHLEEGLAVAEPGPWQDPGGKLPMGPGRTAEVTGCVFVVERWKGLSGTVSAPGATPVTIVPIVGDSTLDGWALEPGSVWAVRDEARLESGPDSDLLVAYLGRQAEPSLLVTEDG